MAMNPANQSKNADTEGQTGQNGPSFAERLRGVRISTRPDLEVTRHVFRGRPAYVVRDPLTCQNHQLSPGDYDIFVTLNASRSLGELFEELVNQGRIDRDQEESFYQFVVSLHRLNFLNLPVSDEKTLYQRHEMRRRARRKEKLLGFLFLRVPLVNPDAFLDRTVRYAAPVFSKWFFAGWVVLVAAAAFTAARNFGDLIHPAQGVLAARNLPIMWVTLIGLKIVHEFGHAYACKLYGGRVPEMGAFFIVFTPCAYVDATACWGFTKRSQRLAVCLAGMYVESIIASLAVFAWAFSAPGLLHDVAYNVLFLAGVVTILFNINPLMRYDGYYVLSDLLEIPNLRSRATRQVVGLLKRIFVGVPMTGKPASLREWVFLLGFGIAASLYRVALTLAIAAMIASKMFLVGLGVAVFYVGNTVVGLVRRTTRYLWYAQESAPVRARAIAVSILLLAGIPALITLLPVGSQVQAAGVVGSEEELVIRAPSDGFLTSIATEPGLAVQGGDVLIEMTNDDLDETIMSMAAEVRASDIRREAYEVNDPASALEEERQGQALRSQLEQARERRSRLIIRTDADGLVVDGMRKRDSGRFVSEGDALATVARGRWQLRAVLSEDQIADARPKPGDMVEVCFKANPLEVCSGVVERVASAATRTIPADALTHAGGGEIAVEPESGMARQPHFVVTIALESPDFETLRHGMTGQVRFSAETRSIATVLVRRLIRFANSLKQR